MVVLLGAFVVAASARAEPEIRFNRDIRPVLSENCFACHGPDKNARQADLRLDRRTQAVNKGAIQPSDPAGSKLVERIHAENEILRMPPVWSGKKLTAEQKDLLVRWIKQGAKYEPHWAYIPPKRPQAPAGSEAIDALVGQKLKERGLAPVGEADRRTLARRLSFDLTGLPPKPELVEGFEHDPSPDAYEQLVERLLASPHFGERMAVHWLDLVRYADTVGFHGDVAVNVYPYRDYVIRAFNNNKPFDVFTREQLGGDLMPDATLWQQVASAYNRLSRMTNEGGSQAKEYLAKYAADRVRTTSTTWLGSTMGCAECHDHKFDPFSAKDFYAMQAFFADIKEEGVFTGYGDWGTKVRVPSAEGEKELQEIDRRLADLRREGSGKLPATAENLEEFAAYLRREAERWQALEPVSLRSDCSHPDIDGCDRFELRVEDSNLVRLVVTGDEKPRKAMHQVEVAPRAGRVTAVMIEIFSNEQCEEFLLSEFRVHLAGRGDEPLPLKITTFVPDWEGPRSMLRDTGDDNHDSGWHGNPTDEGARRAIYVFEKPVDMREGERLLVSTVHNRLYGLKEIAHPYRLSATDSNFPELPPQDDVRDAVSRKGARTDAQQQALTAAFSRITASNPHWKEIRALERRKKTLVDNADECLVSQAVKPRTVRVLPRGNWMDDSGEIVEPRAPHFLKAIPANGRRLSRLELGNWLVDRENPLTARVFVNRLWHVFFGTGISKILDDIGSQGEPPVNQPLLDWLAVEFMESGWDVKHIIRTMLLSETYRRSSEPSAELRQADPYNRLHGRQTALRLEAEFIRDNALAVSGLLNPKVGGPSAKPYQPPGYYKELNFPKREYQPDLNENQFRRGLYTHWQRTFLHPSLMAFDAPSREECTAQRVVSNTPLQSLTLLNDPTYVEAAKAFAARILQSGRNDPSARIDFAYRRAFSRQAEPEEREVLLALLESQRQRFEQEPARAESLLATGIWTAPRELAKTELAAWTMVARALLNKHEFVMRY